MWAMADNEVDPQKALQDELRERDREFLTAVVKTVTENNISVPQAVLSTAMPHMEFYSGQNTVRRCLLLLMEKNQLQRSDAIELVKRLKRDDWLYEWFPEAIPEQVRVADAATEAKRVAGSQNGLLRFLNDRVLELPSHSDPSHFWRAILILLDRRTISRNDAREFLLKGGFNREADQYIPLEQPKRDAGQASGEVDDWWRYD